MSNTPARVVVQSINDAIALLTYDLGALAGNAPLRAVGPRVEHLHRALARLETLIVTHPGLSIDEMLPPGSLPEDEAQSHLAQAAELDAHVRLAPRPTSVALRAGTIPADACPLTHDLARALQGTVLVVMPQDGDNSCATGTVDVGAALARAVLQVLPDQGHQPTRRNAAAPEGAPRDDEDDDGIEAVVSPAVLALRRRASQRW